MGLNYDIQTSKAADCQRKAAKSPKLFWFRSMYSYYYRTYMYVLYVLEYLRIVASQILKVPISLLGIRSAFCS